MANLHELIQTWHHLHGIAPDLLIPITDDETLARATAAVWALSEEIQASTDGPHPLDDLVRLVLQRITTYEAEHYPIPDTDGASTLGFLIDQHKITQQQLADKTGIKQATISQLLNRKRPITADHARKLGQFFKVNFGVFL